MPARLTRLVARYRSAASDLPPPVHAALAAIGEGAATSTLPGEVPYPTRLIRATGAPAGAATADGSAADRPRPGGWSPDVAALYPPPNPSQTGWRPDPWARGRGDRRRWTGAAWTDEVD